MNMLFSLSKSVSSYTLPFMTIHIINRFQPKKSLSSATNVNMRFSLVAVLPFLVSAVVAQRGIGGMWSLKPGFS